MASGYLTWAMVGRLMCGDDLARQHLHLVGVFRIDHVWSMQQLGLSAGKVRPHNVSRNLAEMILLPAPHANVKAPHRHFADVCA